MLPADGNKCTTLVHNERIHFFCWGIGGIFFLHLIWFTLVIFTLNLFLIIHVVEQERGVDPTELISFLLELSFHKLGAVNWTSFLKIMLKQVDSTPHFVPDVHEEFYIHSTLSFGDRVHEYENEVRINEIIWSEYLEEVVTVALHLTWKGKSSLLACLNNIGKGVKAL